MHVAVYLPLIVPILAAGSARRLAMWLPPRLASWLLTCAATVLAATSALALAALTAVPIGRMPAVARWGRWSTHLPDHDGPISLLVGLAAAGALCAGVCAAGWTLVRRTRAVRAAARFARTMPGTELVVVLDDPNPEAYAIPGSPGRIVVTTGMLAALDESERRALLAHERAHLTGRHHLFVAAADLAAAANPLLRPLAAGVRYTTERWADESAATGIGDRRVVARAIGKAALRTRHAPGGPALALAVTGRDPLRGGPVPRRVAALLAPGPEVRRTRGLAAAAVGVVGFAAASCLHAIYDLNILLEHARLSH
ncbi:M56 family metallopeptidase [Nocardia sp. BMG111209]|uniref:M56 family metallopeptidase n=1 Tax=Nocardia sp. BMG111209 TaxID=1160137 RepID=UPI00036F819E|nr:M56 family metallopeptidase [Nocardia sp. BMG111209]